MDVIIGGAYQGKLEYAMDKYKLREEDIYECTEDKGLVKGKRCFYHYEKYLLYCYRNGIEAASEFKDDSVVILDDIFCGVVPIDAEIRGWREFCGRASGDLTRKAEHVTRIFCGLPQVLK